MIKVNVIKKDNVITNINIIGHAGYDVSGKDIVCSAVSSITITTINALLKYDKDSISYKNSLEITSLCFNIVISKLFL